MRGVLGLVFGSVIFIYLISVFLLKHPFFQIREIKIDGLYREELARIEKDIHSLGRGIIFIPESSLFQLINERLSNRFESLNIYRNFSMQGITIQITLQRRKALSVVKIDGKRFLMDGKGILFLDEHQKPKKTLSLYSEGVLKAFKEKLIDLLGQGNSVKVYRDKVIVNVYKRKFILPPLEDVNEEKIRLMKKLLKLYPNAKIFDIRYEDFILLNER